MVKRIFDVFASSFGLILLLPIFLLIATWIKIDSPGSVIFKQKRVGKNGITFQILKFRTMSLSSEKGGSLTIGRDKRITRSGHFLRKFKLDELPQLINILSGDMSLVGPRPEVPEFLDYYAPDVRVKVLSVRPGLTDLASIQMIDENEILAAYSDPQKAYVEVILPLKQQYYLDYIAKSNFGYDIHIIFLTIKKIILR